MNVEVENNLKENEISLFLKSEDSNIFQSEPMIRTLESLDGHKIVSVVQRNSENIVTGFLMGVIQKEHSGIIGFFSSRSIIIGGPIILNNDPRILDALLKKYNKAIKGKVIYSQFRNLRKFLPEEVEVFKNNGFELDSHLDILHDLRIPVEDQWMKLHKGRRKNVRRAERMGLIFDEVQNDNQEEFEICFDLVKQTYERVKLPMPSKEYFLHSWAELSKGGVFRVFVARYNDDIVATRMVLCYNSMIYDWYTGANPSFMDKYPNDFLPWKIMEWGSLNNYNVFDFGGAGKPDVPYGVRDHKLKFGGELVNFGRFQKNHFPILYGMILFAFNLYRKYLVK